MSDNIIFIAIGALIGILAIMVVAFLIIQKKSANSDVARINKLRKGTSENNFNKDILYQKLYIRYMKSPFIKRYLLKVRRRIEINNLDDEFSTRMQTAQIITRVLGLMIPLTIGVIIIAHNNLMLLTIILIFELFLFDSFMDSSVDKLDSALLLQQMDFFSQMRHSYHENNMVAEAIYATAQDSEHIQVSRQAERIYTILNSSDPETELEKYYDIAPNNYIKEFAGISYLTQEFGDRKQGDTSLYLKNLENITQEMQLEILKRDKLSYTFKSLSLISIAPILLLEPIKNWSVSNFSFTKSFYVGSKGMLIQILIMILTFVCYILIRKLQDNQATKKIEDEQNPWQEKLYKIKPIGKFVELFIPKRGTKEYRALQRLIKDAGSKLRIRWLYINRIISFIAVFIVSMAIFFGLHKMQAGFVYTDPTSDYDMMTELEGKSLKLAMEKTERQNDVIKKLKGKTNITIEEIQKEMPKANAYYKKAKEDEIITESQNIYDKLQIVNNEFLKWYEVLLSLIFAAVGYQGPILLLKFQLKMRQMEMEDEVMQYQTIIMMLMKIERVDVEMILEWLARYSDIFKEPINKCLNNYESGAWESLEDMKNEVTYQPFIRIIESLQTSVEKVPIREAFEELDADRDYYKDKRKETNDRLISRKAMIGKVVGFAPMVVAFVGYLIGPLILIGMSSMTTTFSALSKET